jgi:hypothetical protein
MSTEQAESQPKAQPSNPFKEHRIKILLVSQNLLVDIFNWWRNPTHCLALPMVDKLPDDTFVVAVHTNFSRRCLEVVVCSAQFPVCPIECLPEVIPGAVTEFRKVSFDQLGVKLNRNPGGSDVDVNSIS